MDGIDYTIRSVPQSVDAALRKLAFEKSKSLDLVVVEVLKRGLEHESSLLKHHDLDFLVGSWKDDPQVDHALADFGKVDKELWK